MSKTSTDTLKENERQNFFFEIFASNLCIYNPGQKLWPKLRKTALYLTPQAMYNQFKRPSAGSVSELYYICRKT